MPRPEVWCGLVTQRHHESAQSNERYIQVSISPIFIFCLNNILPSPSFHVAVERDNKRTSFDQETMKEEHIVIKNFIET